ncbi:hypothetical protein Dimus_008534 [Dionaea muscipula]
MFPFGMAILLFGCNDVEWRNPSWVYNVGCPWYYHEGGSSVLLALSWRNVGFGLCLHFLLWKWAYFSQGASLKMATDNPVKEVPYHGISLDAGERVQCKNCPRALAVGGVRFLVHDSGGKYQEQQPAAANFFLANQTSLKWQFLLEVMRGNSCWKREPMLFLSAGGDTISQLGQVMTLLLGDVLMELHSKWGSRMLFIILQVDLIVG